MAKGGKGNGAKMALPAARELYKEDGSKINNPEKYVATVERQGYIHPLFTADGTEVRDPVAYIFGKAKRPREDSERRAPVKKQRSAGGEVSGEAVMFMENGTPIKNPAAYVAKIEVNGYNKPLFTKTGQEIKNPVAYLNKNASGSGNPYLNGKATVSNAPQRTTANGSPGKQMFKKDGSLIKNPAKILDAIKHSGYTEALYTADGKEIRDPLAFAGKQQGGKQTKQVDAWGSGGAEPWVAMYKEDGALIRNPDKVLASIEQNGYTQILFTADGREIKNPLAFANKPAANHSRPAANHSSDVQMFKGDGAQIRNVDAVLAAIEHNGYTQTLYTADGKEIKNPLRFAGTAQASGPKKQKAPPSGGGSVQMYKADGSLIRNVDAILASIESKGYTQPLYTAEGTEIKNPGAFVASQQGAGGAVFKGDGTMVRNPAKILEAIVKNGYTEQLFTASGAPIRDPLKKLAGIKELKPSMQSGKATYYGRPTQKATPTTTGRRFMNAAGKKMNQRGRPGTLAIGARPSRA